MEFIRLVRKRLSKVLQKIRAKIINKNKVRYHLDEISLDVIAGWLCIEHVNFFVACKVHLILNGKLLENTNINIMREDLLSAGMGNGRHGFSATLDWTQFELGENILELKTDQNINAVIRFTITHKQMMVALSQSIIKHIDVSVSNLISTD
jgi:hypothetical protein